MNWRKWLVPYIKIVEAEAILENKGTRKFFGEVRYYFIFRVGDTLKTVQVGKGLYEHMKIGWRGTVGYMGKKLISIS